MGLRGMFISKQNFSDSAQTFWQTLLNSCELNRWLKQAAELLKTFSNGQTFTAFRRLCSLCPRLSLTLTLVTAQSWGSHNLQNFPYLVTS